jgi:hypothetical protein
VQKNTQIIADEYLDIDEQIKLIDAREDMSSGEKRMLKKGLLDEIDQYIHQLGSVSAKPRTVSPEDRNTAELKDSFKKSKTGSLKS